MVVNTMQWLILWWCKWNTFLHFWSCQSFLSWSSQFLESERFILAWLTRLTGTGNKYSCRIAQFGWWTERQLNWRWNHGSQLFAQITYTVFVASGKLTKLKVLIRYEPLWPYSPPCRATSATANERCRAWNKTDYRCLVQNVIEWRTRRSTRIRQFFTELQAAAHWPQSKNRQKSECSCEIRTTLQSRERAQGAGMQKKVTITHSPQGQKIIR